jgi:hypothetical protein
MIDELEQAVRMIGVEREDRALLRSNPSARLDAGTGTGVWLNPDACLPCKPVLAPNAINLTVTWTEHYPSVGPRGVTYVKISRAEGCR